jgi:hypothetical protein
MLYGLLDVYIACRPEPCFNLRSQPKLESTLIDYVKKRQVQVRQVKSIRLPL